MVKKSLIILLFNSIAFYSFSQTLPSRVETKLMQYFQNQEYAKAAQYIKQGEEFSDIPDKNFLSLLGYAYYMSHQYAEAATSFESLLKIDTVNSKAVYYLGKINAVKGNIPKALQYYCRLIEQKPGVASYYKQLAALWEQLDNQAAAGWYYKLAYKANPNDAIVTASLASHWIDQELYAQADRILDRALGQDSLQALLLQTRIRSAYEQEHYKEIFPLTRRLRKMHFLSLKPYFREALAWFKLEKYDSCVTVCQFLDKNKLKTRATMYLEALSYKALQQYDKALSRLNTCISMAIDEAANDYYTEKGAVLELMHQPSKALKQYDTAYYIFQNPIQLYNKAKIYDVQFENYPTALRFYQRYLNRKKKPNEKDRIKVTAFVEKRTKQLEAWQKSMKK